MLLLLLLLLLFFTFKSQERSVQHSRHETSQQHSRHETITQQQHSRHETITRQQMEGLHYLIATLLKFMKKYNVEYWIIGGTLIGGIRNEPPGVLYWDDDADFGLLQEQEEKVKKMLKDPEFCELITVKEIFFGYQLYHKNVKIYIDLFVYENKSDNVYYPRGKNWQWDYILVDEVFPIEYKKFWDLMLPYPKQAVKLLKRGFGEQVLTHVKKWNHRVASNTSVAITKLDKTPLHLVTLF